MLQNNHKNFSNIAVYALGTQWIQTNHKGFSNSGTCAFDVQLCPQVTSGSPESIIGSNILYMHISDYNRLKEALLKRACWVICDCQLKLSFYVHLGE